MFHEYKPRISYIIPLKLNVNLDCWYYEGGYEIYKVASSKRTSEGNFDHERFSFQKMASAPTALENLSLNFENKAGLNYEAIQIR